MNALSKAGEILLSAGYQPIFPLREVQHVERFRFYRDRDPGWLKRVHNLVCKEWPIRIGLPSRYRHQKVTRKRVESIDPARYLFHGHLRALLCLAQHLAKRPVRTQMLNSTFEVCHTMTALKK
jgi:hypothetical protein